MHWLVMLKFSNAIFLLQIPISLCFGTFIDVCIAIRLVYKKKDEICIRSGAGIVADSVPEKEFEECQNKARAVVRAISQAEEGLE